MVRRTYGSVKNTLARLCGGSGMSVNDPRVMAYTNEAIEELMLAKPDGWPMAVDRLKFNLTKNTFVLPSDYDRILYCTVCGIPVPTTSPWFQFIGAGLEWIGSYSSEDALESRHYGVLDKDTAATFQEIPVGDGNIYYPRVYAEADERVNGVRPSIVIQGYDDNGRWIRTSDGAGGYIDGVSIELNGDTAPWYVQSSQPFSYVTGTIKPVTKKNVMLWASTVDGSIMWYIGQYAAGDETPLYRQYSIPTLALPTDDSVTKTVIARCLRRFVPIRRDADFLIISNLPALKAMVQSVYYRESDDIALSTQYRMAAVQILREEANAYIGMSNQKPLITMSESAVGDGYPYVQ